MEGAVEAYNKLLRFEHYLMMFGSYTLKKVWKLVEYLPSHTLHSTERCSLSFTITLRPGALACALPTGQYLVMIYVFTFLTCKLRVKPPSTYCRFGDWSKTGCVQKTAVLGISYNLEIKGLCKTENEQSYWVRRSTEGCYRRLLGIFD